MVSSIVWKKSIYDNDFKCTKCGTKLFNAETNEPTDKFMVPKSFENGKPSVACCGKCYQTVATISFNNLEGVSGLHGNINDALEDYTKKNKKLEKEIKETQELKENLTEIMADYERLKYKLKTKDEKIFALEKQISEMIKSHDKEKLKLEHEIDRLVKLKIKREADE